MKIHKNILMAYWLEALLAIVLLAGSTGGGDAGIVMIVIAVLLILYCVADYLGSTLECDGKILKGHTGIIKRKTLNVALSKVQYCSLDRMLVFTTIKINAVTGTYEFKNMSRAGAFVQYVTERL